MTGSCTSLDLCIAEVKCSDILSIDCCVCVLMVYVLTALSRQCVCRAMFVVLARCKPTIQCSKFGSAYPGVVLTTLMIHCA